MTPNTFWSIFVIKFITEKKTICDIKLKPENYSFVKIYIQSKNLLIVWNFFQSLYREIEKYSSCKVYHDRNQ